MRELLHSRLHVVGLIRLAEAFLICGKEFNYSDVAYYFKCIMVRMKNEGLAKDLLNGKWIITKTMTGDTVTKIDRYKHWTEDKPKEKIHRPPAVYTNIGSPYGIADELHGKKISN